MVGAIETRQDTRQDSRGRLGKSSNAKTVRRNVTDGPTDRLKTSIHEKRSFIGDASLALFSRLLSDSIFYERVFLGRMVGR